MRIGNQRTANRDQVKFTLFHTLGQGIKPGFFRLLARKRADKVRRQPDRANRNGRSPGQFFRPTGKVQTLFTVKFGEFRFPETALGRVNDVHTGFHQRGQPIGHFIGGCGKAGGKILLFPLANTQDNREVLPNCFAHGFDHFAGKGGPFLDGFAAKAIGAQIRARPEELINQIAMRAMNFKGIKPGIFGIKGGLGKGRDGIGNVGITHGVAARIIRGDKARWAFDRGIWFPAIWCAG